MTNGHRTVPAPAPLARTTCQHPAHAVLVLVRGRDTRYARVLTSLAARIEATR